MLEVNELELNELELKTESEFKPKKYNPRLLLENELEFMVRFPPSAYKPVEEPSSLLLLERKMLPEKWCWRGLIGRRKLWRIQK